MNKKLVKKVIEKQIMKVKESNYNCSPLDYYRPNKPVKKEFRSRR